METKVGKKHSAFDFFGYRHFSLKIPNVEFDINALIGQNLMSNFLFYAMKRTHIFNFDVRFGQRI